MVQVSEWKGARRIGIRNVPSTPNAFDRFYVATRSVTSPHDTLILAAAALEDAGFKSPRAYAVLGQDVKLVAAPGFPPEVGVVTTTRAHPVFDDLLNRDVLVHNRRALQDAALCMSADDPLAHAPLDGLAAIPFHGTPAGSPAAIRGFVVAGYDQTQHTPSSAELGALDDLGRIVGETITHQLEGPAYGGSLAAKHTTPRLESRLRGNLLLLNSAAFAEDGAYTLSRVRQSAEPYHMLLARITGSTIVQVAEYLERTTGAVPYGLGENIYALYLAPGDDARLLSLALRVKDAETALPLLSGKAVSVHVGIMQGDPVIKNQKQWEALARNALTESYKERKSVVAYTLMNMGPQRLHRISF